MLFLLLVGLLVSASAAQAAPDARPCRAALPRGPAVPAPIVFRTSCGGFRLEPNGKLERLPPHWFAVRSGGTGRRYGADLRIVRTRPGRIVLLRRGRMVWRSSGLYYRDGGSIAFGPNAFAFTSWRRGIFVTDLKGPERLVARGVGLYPLGFLRGGELLVVKGGWGPSVSIHAPDGSVLRRYRYRPRNGYQFDERTESLFFVSPGRVLARANGVSVRVVRPLGELDGWMSLAGADLLAFQNNRAVAVIRRDGKPVARASWANSWVLDSGLSVSPDGRTFAFRLARRNASRSRGTAVLYLLRAGETRARAVYRHPLGESGCWSGASLHWHGRSLLYSSSDGHIAIVDGRDRNARSLTELGAQLPQLPHRRFGERPSAHWAKDFVRR